MSEAYRLLSNDELVRRHEEAQRYTPRFTGDPGVEQSIRASRAYWAEIQRRLRETETAPTQTEQPEQQQATIERQAERIEQLEAAFVDVEILLLELQGSFKGADRRTEKIAALRNSNRYKDAARTQNSAEQADALLGGGDGQG